MLTQIFLDGTSPRQVFPQIIHFVLKQSRMFQFFGSSFRAFILHIALIQGKNTKAFNKLSYNCLTNLLGGSPVLNKEGGEVNSAFVDGSAVSFSEFPVLPCCTLKKRVISSFNLQNTQT